MRSAFFIAALVAGSCFSASVLAQDSQGRAQSFVSEVAYAPSGSDRPYARWDNRICVGAVGLSPSDAQTLVDRISNRAQSVGLRTGEPGCQANVMVIYAPDSDTLSRQIVDQRRDLLGNGGDTAGSDALAAFANTPRAVRWWHVSDAGVGGLSDRPGAERSRRSTGGDVAQAAATGDGPSVSGVEGAGNIEGVDAVRSSGSRARQVLATT